jgi:branched-chain amino acid transport system permease protein
MEKFPIDVVLGQLLLGLINGGFYAILSLGLSLIFGMLNIINFAHGAFYMMGAFAAFLLLHLAGLSYWTALAIAPVVIGAAAMLVEKFMLSRLYSLDHIYGWLLTYGLALMIEAVFRHYFGATGRPYPIPATLRGGIDLGFMYLPLYRLWLIIVAPVICLCVLFLVEYTKLGAYLRAGTENPALVQTFGINVPRLVTWTFGCGVGLAALAGVLAGPIYQVSPLMGSNIIVVIFAVVVIGGIGSILGTIVTGLGIGVVEGLTKVLYPEGSHVVIFVIMALVLLMRPAGLFGHTK